MTGMSCGSCNFIFCAKDFVTVTYGTEAKKFSPACRFCGLALVFQTLSTGTIQSGGFRG